MLRHIVAHELAQHLSRRLVLSAADLQELIAEPPLNPNPKTDILHGPQCAQWIHKLPE
jgi:hypothetical protein